LLACTATSAAAILWISWDFAGGELIREEGRSRRDERSNLLVGRVGHQARPAERSLIVSLSAH
jgi:hypothetical protein